MTLKEARQHVGKMSRLNMRRMEKALAMHQWNNTGTENKRLQAVRIVLASPVIR